MLKKRFLQKEMDKWVQKQLISKDQAINISKLYGITYGEEKKNFSIISILGYLFLGLSLIVLIGHNWHEIPPLQRATFLIFTTATLHLLSFYQYKNKNNSNLYFLANMAYGASIILIAQAYHLGTYAPDGVFWWALGSFLVAVFIKNNWVNLQAFILSLIWVLMEVDGDFYPFAFWVFLTLCAYSIYSNKENKTLYFLFLISLVYFVPYTLMYFTYEHVDFEQMVYHFYLIPFFSYFVFLSVYLNRFKPLKPYFGITKISTNLLINFFSFFLLQIDIYTYFSIAIWENEAFSIFLSLILLGTAALTYISKDKDSYVLLAFLITSALTPLLPYSFWLINIILFSYYGYNVYQGIIHGDFSRYFIASFSVLVFAFMRYLSLINDYITAAFFFFICAILLLVSAKIFKKYSGEKS